MTTRIYCHLCGGPIRDMWAAGRMPNAMVFGRPLAHDSCRDLLVLGRVLEAMGHRVRIVAAREGLDREEVMPYA